VGGRLDRCYAASQPRSAGIFSAVGLFAGTDLASRRRQLPWALSVEREGGRAACIQIAQWLSLWVWMPTTMCADVLSCAAVSRRPPALAALAGRLLGRRGPEWGHFMLLSVGAVLCDRGACAGVGLIVRIPGVRLRASGYGELPSGLAGVY
jgi:hypothetical protein